MSVDVDVDVDVDVVAMVSIQSSFFYIALKPNTRSVISK